MVMTKKSKYIDENLLREMVKPYAYKVFKDLSEQSHYVIDSFYKDYTPRVYQRTYGMKNLFRPSMKPIKNGYSVEFIYSVDYLTTEHRSDETVFDGSFINGWHGGQYAWGHEKEFTPRMQPSPWDLLQLYVKTYKI